MFKQKDLPCMFISSFYFFFKIDVKFDFAFKIELTVASSKKYLKKFQMIHSFLIK